MIIVGLTGGIGSGKTTVAGLFREQGIPVYNSDIEAKQLMQTSTTIREAIVLLLGEVAFLDKKLNRKYIASRVFKDKELLQKLNKIVHPAVRSHFSSWAAKQKTAYVIQETAIIFENDAQANYCLLYTSPSPRD